MTTARRNFPTPAASREKAHVERWMTAMHAAWPAYRCTAINRRGEPCGRLSMRGGRKHGHHLCFHHFRGPGLNEIRHLVDLERAERARQRLQTRTNRLYRLRAEGTLRTVEDRRLRRLWCSDPRVEGSTLPPLPADTSNLVEAFLAARGIAAEQTLPGSRHPPTAACLDRCRWAALLHLRGHFDERRAQVRINIAVKQDAKFWRRFEALPAWDAP